MKLNGQRRKLLGALWQLHDDAEEIREQSSKLAEELTEKAETHPEEEQEALMDEARREWDRAQAYESVAIHASQLREALEALTLWGYEDDESEEANEQNAD